MIKTIDTRNITDIMLEAQSVIDGTTTYSDPLSFKDAADIFIAMAEAAPTVEPAQAVPAFWASENVFKESLRDNISCILTTTRCSANTVPLYTVPPAISEPAQAVPGKCEPVAEVLWYEPMLHEPQTKKGHKIIDASLSWMEKAPLGTKLYAAPPAIDEIRHRLILVCEYLETVGLMFVSPRVISSQIRAILEAGNGE